MVAGSGDWGVARTADSGSSSRLTLMAISFILDRCLPKAEKIVGLMKIFSNFAVSGSRLCKRSTPCKENWICRTQNRWR
jgi:hypothetical protein